MADDIILFSQYISLTAIILFTELANALASMVVRYPLIRPILVWKETTDGHLARPALQWMVSERASRDSG